MKCKTCEKEIPATGKRGRPSIYCSPKCRSAERAASVKSPHKLESPKPKLEFPIPA